MSVRSKAFGWEKERRSAAHFSQIALLGVALIPALAQAQTAPIELPVINVAAQPRQTEAENAASEQFRSADRVTEKPASRPGEVLETVPGLVVTQHSGEGKANQYFLRGFNLDHGTDLAGEAPAPDGIDRLFCSGRTCTLYDNFAI